jgi:hypothetical protein
MSFTTLALKHFQFLENDYQFTLISSASSFIRYESEDVLLILYQNTYSFELELEVGRMDWPGRTYNLPTIIRALDPSYKGQQFFQASSRHVIEKCLMEMSQLVRRICRPLFMNDVKAFHHVEMTARMIAKETTIYYTINPIKREAYAAWKQKDLKKVIKLYSEIEPHLSELERKRLQYR